MRNLQLVMNSIPTWGLLHALTHTTVKWTEMGWRVAHEESPFYAEEDIWLRFTPPALAADLGAKWPVLDSTEVVWWPNSRNFPAAKALALDLMRAMDGYSLERLIVTRLPPGKTVAAHKENSGSYDNQLGLNKYLLVLNGLAGVVLRCGPDATAPKAGDAWWYRHKEQSEIVNNSEDDLVTLRVDFRVGPGPGPAMEVSFGNVSS